MQVIYFSSTSNTTHKFVQRLELPSRRLPVLPADEPVLATEPFVLIVPTYGGGYERSAVPKQVLRFLKVKENRDLMRGVISAGNRNFGTAYCIAADMISQKCRTPVLYRFELLGTSEDVAEVRSIISALD